MPQTRTFAPPLLTHQRCHVPPSAHPSARSSAHPLLVRSSRRALRPGFDIYRIIKSSTVAHRTTPGALGPEVVYQLKNALEILEIYNLRAKLHRQVYQHRIANVAEAMITVSRIQPHPAALSLSRSAASSRIQPR